MTETEVTPLFEDNSLFGTLALDMLALCVIFFGVAILFRKKPELPE